MNIVHVLEGKNFELRLKFVGHSVISGAYVDVYKGNKKIDVFTNPYISGDSIFLGTERLKAGNYVLVTNVIANEIPREIKTQVFVRKVLE